MKLLIASIALLFMSPAFAQVSPAEHLKARTDLKEQIESSLTNELLNKWYPHCIDTLYGGFITTYTYDFKPTVPQDKFIVTQARHTWTTAKAAIAYPDNTSYSDCAKHGFRFLKEVMWDSVHGGFHNLVDRQGRNKSNPAVAKEAYGNAFAIFALAAYYKSTGDTAALNLAKKAFLWLERAHDPVYKGYFQHLHADGTPVMRGADTPSTSDLGYKDQNSSIHLLEAFTELYTAWPDPLVRERLEEMFLLIRDTITTPKGSLTLFLRRDWTPVSFRDSAEASVLRHRKLDHISFGHDVETAFLLIEASHALGRVKDSQTFIVAKRMVDHALKNGWDNKSGGFFDEGYYFKNRKNITIIRPTKNWWAQAEGLNALLLMADLFPHDRMQYFEKFKKQWEYINTYLIDHVYGEWYSEGLDKSPDVKTSLKGHIWKGNYHQYRALQNCVNRLASPGADHQNGVQASGEQLLPVSLHPYGRTLMNESNHLEMISSASHVGFSFEGTKCTVEVGLPPWLDHNYIQYELDGVYQKKLRINHESSSISITASKPGRHTVWIYKATEAHTGPVIIRSVRGNKITSIQRPTAPLIEFIGNSITCGAAADPSDIPCGAGVYHDQHNAYMAYGPRVARALQANFTVSGVSGIGIYRTWNADHPSMDKLYEQTDFSEKSTHKWNFKSQSPQIVSIALGTNDLSRGDGKNSRLPFDSAVFVNRYVAFVQLVKSHYPDARVALLSSAMVNGSDRELLQNCLSAIKISVDALYPASQPAALHFFKPMQARGCTGHPSVEDHAILAEELIPFFKSLLP
jgi:mannobiose 2-epimerase